MNKEQSSRIIEVPKKNAVVPGIKEQAWRIRRDMLRPIYERRKKK